MNKYEELEKYLVKNKSTWLITGVAGFIGSNLLERLLILNQKVVGLDNFDTGHQYNIDQVIDDANITSGKNLSKNFKFINGDGETSRDFCYIDNTIQINILAVVTDNNNANNQVYNVAANDRTSLNKLYRMIEDKFIENTKGLKKKNPIYRDFRVGDIKHSQANIAKAKKLLNYDPKYNISEGMDEAIEWYVNNLSKKIYN